MNVGAIYASVLAAAAIATTLIAGLMTRSVAVAIVYALYSGTIWALFFLAVLSKC